MYLIPRNISQRFEFAPGYGWKELIFILCSFLIGLALFYILKILGVSTFPRLLILIIATAAGIMANSPVMADGTTAIKMLKYMIQYQKSQKLYLYKKEGL